MFSRVASETLMGLKQRRGSGAGLCTLPPATERAAEVEVEVEVWLCDEVVTVQSKVVKKVTARRWWRRERVFRKMGSPEWGWCRWGS